MKEGAAVMGKVVERKPGTLAAVKAAAAIDRADKADRELRGLAAIVTLAARREQPRRIARSRWPQTGTAQPSLPSGRHRARPARPTTKTLVPV
jgi:hypothetical protein